MDEITKDSDVQLVKDYLADIKAEGMRLPRMEEQEAKDRLLLNASGAYAY